MVSAMDIAIAMAWLQSVIDLIVDGSSMTWHGNDGNVGW